MCVRVCVFASICLCVRSCLRANSLRGELTPTLQKAMDLARERGSSNCLTSLPLEEHCFVRHKGAFVDAHALRYGWALSRTPSSCECGASFTVEHVLSCPRGGFPSIRHNEIRDITANLLTEVCRDVQVEPDLQEVSNEVLSGRSAITTDGTRLDIAASGFWGGRYERTFLDVRVFNPYAPSNRQTTTDKCFQKHEMEKKKAYEQRVREIEHASFTACSLRKWRPRQGGNEFLQALGLQAGREVGPFLQPDHELVAMHLVICSTPLRNSVRSGCSLHSWPCRQGLLFACRFGISRGQHSTLLVTVFLVTPILFHSYLVQ